jgi:hypothetical protein
MHPDFHNQQLAGPLKTILNPGICRWGNSIPAPKGEGIFLPGLNHGNFENNQPGEWAAGNLMRGIPGQFASPLFYISDIVVCQNRQVEYLEITQAK